jgi:hypothetical protein
MGLSNVAKSTILRRIIHSVPHVMNQKAVQILTTDPTKAVFGLEDGAEAQGDVSMNEGGIGDVTDKIKDIRYDIFPNVKLAAELEACKDMDRATYDEFSDTWDQLQKITTKIDGDYAPLINRFLMDEIASIDGVDQGTVNSIIDMKVDLETVNSENPNLNLK